MEKVQRGKEQKEYIIIYIALIYSEQEAGRGTDQWVIHTVSFPLWPILN